MNREEVLAPYNLLDTLPEDEYDALTEIAASICQTPIALVVLVDDNRQYFKSHYGLETAEASLEDSFCWEAIKNPDEPLVVEDAKLDSRFQKFKTVTGFPHVVFYVGIPLRGVNGEVLGTLSVIDHKPNQLSSEQLNFLRKLARQVEKLFELRRSKFSLEEKNLELSSKTERLENIIEATEAGTWEWDCITDIVNVSNRWLAMGGYQREEVGILSIERLNEFVHPEDRDESSREFNRCLVGEIDLFNKDVRFKCHNGSYIWVNTRGKVIERSATGIPEKMFGTNINITSRKTTEALTEFSEKRFRALVQEGSDLIAILDHEANYLYVSPTSKHVLGSPPEAYIGKSAFDLIHPDDVEQVAAEFLELTHSKRIKLKPFRFANEKGEWRWMETTVTNLLDDPSVNGIVANSRDITLRKEDENHRRLLESVVLNAHDAILITEAEPVDHPGPRIIYVNEAFTKMTGYEPEEVIGKTPRILQGPDSNYEDLAKMGQKLKKWQPSEVTTINYKKNGEKFWINFTTIPVADENGWYTHWIAIERDVTHLVNKEREKKLLADIGRIFNKEEDLKTCLKTVLDHIIEFDTFEIAEIWLPDSDRKNLILSTHTCRGEEGKSFYERTSGVQSFEMGSGLPGVVGTNKEDVFWDLDSNDQYFLRRDAASEVGILTVMGIPLIHNEVLMGVLVLGSPNRIEELFHLKKLLSELRYFFGAEIKRKKLENELKALFDSAPDIIAITNLHGYFVRVNPSAEKILGYSEEELTSKPYGNFIHPEDRERTDSETFKLAKGKSTNNFDNRYISSNGEIVWLSWTARSLPEQGLVYAVAKDITEIKKTEQERKKLLEEKNSILESLGDGFFSVDRNWTVRYWNRRAELYLGKKREDILGKNLWEIYPDVVHLDFYKYYHKAIETMETQQFVEYYPATQNWFEVNAYPAPDGLTVFFRDITERMGYIKSIEEQNRRFQDIAFTQSHVVRAPLARILGLVSLLLDTNNLDSSDRDDMLKLLQNSASELDEVIHEIVRKTDISRFPKAKWEEDSAIN